jgi:hypothetical protein
MIASINEKDANAYINILNAYFIKVTYGDKEFIRQNMKSFGHVELLKIAVMTINTYVAQSITG